ncbi:hypothetical protein EMCRGX_G028511 [Ephydatia muelleri]
MSGVSSNMCKTLQQSDEDKLATVLANFDTKTRRAVSRSVGCKPSSWLTVLPISLHHFDLSAAEFRDSLTIHYHRPLIKAPANCDRCGEVFSLTHALDCRKGGLVIQRHNEIRDAIGMLLLFYHLPEKRRREKYCDAAEVSYASFTSLVVSIDAVLEIYPWTSWCYSQHPKLWHPVGSISSASGVQQGDPLGPLLFALVLQSVLKKLAADPQCQQLLLNAWYLDDGALAGPGSAVLRALEVLGADGKPNGLILNPSKCELFSPNTDTFQPFDSSIPTSTTPNFEILGAPIGSPEFCGEYIEAKRKQACSLLHLLPQLCDPQVSILLLRHCASFCKLSHLGRSVPPCDSSLRQFMLFDEDVLHCLEECAAFELTLSATKQVQLPLRHGGLGLTSVSNHSSSAFISSLSNAIDVTSAPNASHHLKQAIALYNTKINSADAITFESVTSSPPQQHHLSGKIEDNSFQTLLINSTVCTRARLRAVSASNANAWLRAIPCIHNDLALEPQEMQVLLKWWLGLPVFSADSKCPFCSSALDPDCHHALTCRSGGDVIARHNKLRDCVANLCSKACLSPQLEKGPGIDFSRPADVLVPNWSLSNPAAFDLKVIHPLNTDLILEASLASGNSAEVGEIEKHAKNDQMCARLGWTCIPLVVEVYGGWGCEAKECYSRLSKRLAMQVGICETEALCQMYCLLAVTLMRQNARAILLRCARAPLLEYSH